MREAKNPDKAWRWALIWTLITFVTVWISHVYIDIQLHAWSQWAGLGAARVAAETVTVLGRLTWYAAALAVLAPVAALVGARARSLHFSLALLSLLATGIVVQIAKPIAGRYRPKTLDDGLYGFAWFDYSIYDTGSFPSGHTATIAAVVAGLWMMIPKWRDLLILPVLAVGVSRLLCGSHYLSDVIAGAYIGAMTTFLVYRAAGRFLPMMTSVKSLPFE